MLRQHEEVEGEGGALEAGGRGGGEVGGDHPPVHGAAVELPGQLGGGPAGARGAVDADLVPRQVDCLLESWRHGDSNIMLNNKWIQTLEQGGGRPIAPAAASPDMTGCLSGKTMMLR